MVCKYCTDFNVSTRPLSGHRSYQTLKRLFKSYRTLNGVLHRTQTDRHTHTHTYIYTHTISCRCDMCDPLTPVVTKIYRRFGKETAVNFYQKTIILIFITSFFAFLCRISVHSKMSRPALRPTQSPTQ